MSASRNKAASGAEKWLPVRRHETVAEAYAALRHSGHQVLVAHFTDGAYDYREIDYTQATALVVGAELEGLSGEAIEQADAAVTVPMRGMTQSLNVSVATALILYEAMRQRERVGYYDGTRMKREDHNAWLASWAEL